MYKLFVPEVKVIGVTMPVVDYIPEAEDLISYTARVSNPSNQENFDTAEGLLKYCIRNKHWSVFEMATLIMEIKAPRDISRQILRHKSGNFQEFSQRYSEVTDDMFVLRELRMQDTENRQNSLEVDDKALQAWWEISQRAHINNARSLYKEALASDIAKEQARCVLPEGNTMSCMYMNASMRTWLHYVDLRSKKGETQKEHVLVAEACREAIKEYFPTLMNTLENK